MRLHKIIGGIRMKNEEKEPYITPEIDIIEFHFEDSIASSTDFGPDAFCGLE
jgi:sucrose-6-phosphate hydrolase SacC (GH32 family)